MAMETRGIYTIADIDGRARRVDYVADAHGFRASVKTNEPGTAASAPAAALIASPYAGPVAPVVNHVPQLHQLTLLQSLSLPPAVYRSSRTRSRSRSCCPAAAYGGALGLGHGAALGLAAPAAAFAYGGALGHGALGYGYGLGLGKALLH
ncbi:adult-specific rigid cuticular protein 15.7 [Trichonephila clavata]|uniref:Adult-specific rigid cuticular protein 15.7 n=1 Tax=Trichonephila clavata TaxID=2740835 RepID=A0A8X6LYT9_TRICU|nr:adult-specific rigid cuticular protein 15.7 [Trichonephila clavata]